MYINYDNNIYKKNINLINSLTNSHFKLMTFSIFLSIIYPIVSGWNVRSC